MKRRSALGALIAIPAIPLLACDKASPSAHDVTLVAAASLRGVLPALARSYEANHPNVHIVASYGASGDLQKQVEAGAPVDGVIFAAGKPVDALLANGKLEPGSRSVIAENQIVLIGPKGQKPITFATLGTLAPGELIAIGDPGAVPAGQYARDYLTRLGAWESLQGRLVFGGDVAAVLAYARRGEAAAAIVYRTEIRGVADVVVLDEAKGPLAPRPEVVSGVVRGSARAADAGAFFAFVAGPVGQRILGEFGFVPRSG